MEFSAAQIDIAKSVIALGTQRAALDEERRAQFIKGRLQARTKLSVPEVEELLKVAAATPDAPAASAPATGETLRMSDKVDAATEVAPEPPTRTGSAKKKAAARKKASPKKK